MHQNALLKHKEELEEVIERLSIIRVGRDFSTLICPWNAVVAFIDEMEKMQFHITGFEWWCHVAQGHEPCGLGGPRDRCGNGWYSELPIDTFFMLESNAAYRRFFTVEYPNCKDYKPCFVPAFCLETLET